MKHLTPVIIADILRTMITVTEEDGRKKINCVNCGHRNWLEVDEATVPVLELTREDIGLVVKYGNQEGILCSFKIEITTQGFKGYVDIEHDSYDNYGGKESTRVTVKNITDTVLILRPI